MGAVLGLSAYGRSQEKIATTNTIASPTIGKPAKTEDPAL
jgi:hypothetical protein